jgi:hypothetical protein
MEENIIIVPRLSFSQRLLNLWRGLTHCLFGSYTYLEQRWQSVKADIDVRSVLIEYHPPFRFTLDLSTLSSGERSIVSVEYGIVGQAGLGDATRWVLSDEYDLYRTREASGKEIIKVNDNTIGGSVIVTIPIDYGPWKVRVTYRQVSGVSRMVRYIVYKDRN